MLHILHKGIKDKKSLAVKTSAKNSLLQEIKTTIKFNENVLKFFGLVFLDNAQKF